MTVLFLAIALSACGGSGSGKAGGQAKTGDDHHDDGAPKTLKQPTACSYQTRPGVICHETMTQTDFTFEDLRKHCQENNGHFQPHQCPKANYIGKCHPHYGETVKRYYTMDFATAEDLCRQDGGDFSADY